METSLPLIVGTFTPSGKFHFPTLVSANQNNIKWTTENVKFGTEALKLEAGTSNITSMYFEIAEIKMPDLNTDDIEQAKKIIAGTARQMGVEIK